MREVARSKVPGSVKHLGVAEQQFDIVQPVLLDPLVRDPEHRLGDVDRHEAAMIPDRRGQRHSQCAGSAADFEHVLPTGNAQTREQ